MGRKAGDKGKNGRGLEPEDRALWKEFTRDIEPLDKNVPDEGAGEEDNTNPPRGAEKRPRQKMIVQPVPRAPVSLQAPQLDARTEGRLKRGKVPVEGKLDLHGRNQEQAHRLLNDFVLRAHRDGKRCVLVITGKGRGSLPAKDWYSPEREDGVLKQKLPLWISMSPLREIVLKSVTASPKDGGGGAFYLYLKRERPYAE